MRVSAAFAVVVAVALPAVADDWPQWMGPQRDNIWREDGLLERFPEGGPKIVWRTPIQGGYAGPAVADGCVYVTDFVKTGEGGGENWDRKGVAGTERVFCLDEKTGKELWKHEYPVVYTISYSAGPRCTPHIHEGKLYTLGAEGDLFCFDAADGAATECAPLEARQAEALERLRISDGVVRGNLIPRVRGALRADLSGQCSAEDETR